MIETLDKTHYPCRTGTFAISHAATPSNACKIQVNGRRPRLIDRRESDVIRHQNDDLECVAGAFTDCDKRLLPVSVRLLRSA